MVQFLTAIIQEDDKDLWTLTIHYTYYNLYNYSENFSFKTLDECKYKLLEIRTYNRLSIIKKS